MLDLLKLPLRNKLPVLSDSEAEARLRPDNHSVEVVYANSKPDFDIVDGVLREPGDIVRG